MPGTIAIEFNESAIKIAEGRRKGNTLDLVKLQIIPTPSGVIKDERLQGQNAADILKKYLTEQYFSASKSLFTRNVTAVVSPASAITRQLLLPLTADSSIASMVKYELKEFFPSSADEYIIRHKNLGEAPEAGGVKKMRIFAAALPRQIVEDYYYFCESLKLKPSAMSINCETAQKVFELCGTINGLELSKFNTVALLDIGFSCSHLHILKNCRTEMSNVIGLGEKHIIEAVAAGFDIPVDEAAAEFDKFGSLAVRRTDLDASEQQKHIDALNNIIRNNVDVLVEEARQILAYYTSRTIGYNIEHVFAYGDALSVNGLDAYVASGLNIQVTRVDHIGGIKVNGALERQRNMFKFVNVIGALISS